LAIRYDEVIATQAKFEAWGDRYIKAPRREGYRKVGKAVGILVWKVEIARNQCYWRIRGHPGAYVRKPKNHNEAK